MWTSGVESANAVRGSAGGESLRQHQRHDSGFDATKCHTMPSLFARISMKTHGRAPNKVTHFFDLPLPPFFARGADPR